MKASCSWHSGRGTQGPRCPTGRSCLICLSLEEQGGWQCLLFITNNFKAQWFCSIADKMLYQLLKVKRHFYSPFSWNIRQEVPLRWFPLSRKPLRLLHPGNGKAAARSPSAASESCCSAWPLSVVLISLIYTDTEHHVHDVPVMQGHLPELEMLRWTCCNGW